MTVKFQPLVPVALALWAGSAAADADVNSKVAAVEKQVIAWRRDIHQHPELSNREVRTAALVAKHLQSLGLEVRTGVGKTGVVGVLKGAMPGKVIALRADMDALPVEEQTGLPFASKVTTDYDGKTVPVMHACGHDAHTAILMGAAQVLASMKSQIAGTVVFIFQPAEEGAPPGEEGGASEMIKDGALRNPKPDAIFALHVEPGVLGRIDVRHGALLANATDLRIDLKGRQTHGARPWEGTDLVNLSADIVKSMTTISARQVDVFDVPNVVTIAMVQAGLRNNILPGEATLQGTVRTYSEDRLQHLKELIATSVDGLARSYGASAQVSFEQQAYVTGSDPKILEHILPALKEAAGEAGVDTMAPLRAAAEDFSFFEREIPGVYYIIGSTKDFKDKASTPSNHSPRFDIDERVLAIGVRAQVLTTLRFLRDNP